MAQLHNHAANWERPLDFSRRHWDWDGLFGDEAGFNLSGREVWALLPRSYFESFEAVAGRTRQVMVDLGTGPDAYGLIHTDLSLGGGGNVLLSAGEARPIDFDDCGYGYWVYDFAVPLCHWRESESWPRIRDALLDGYAGIRLLPQKQLAHLELFMAARHVSEILWAVDQVQVNPRFHEELEGWLEWAAMHVRQYRDRCSAAHRF
jgi:Ser/Thr protein kinase RdoA (MazF antagonist)